MIAVAVLPGWTAFCGIDSDGVQTPEKLHIYKNIYSQPEMLSHPGITVIHYPVDRIFLSAKSFYDDVQDLAPFRLGGRLWEGYTCTSLGCPYTMLESTDETGTLQVMILTENGGEQIRLEDPDVRMILQSITIHQEEAYEIP